MNLSDLLNKGGFIQVNKYLVDRIGLKEAVLLGCLCSKHSYWVNQGRLGVDGFFYCEAKNFKKETSLSAKQQLAAFDNLERLGLIQTDYRGIPRAKYFKINIESLENFLINAECDKQ